MYDLKIHYHCKAKAKQNDAFEVEIFNLAKKFGLQLVRDHFDSVNLIKMIYFRAKN